MIQIYNLYIVLQILSLFLAIISAHLSHQEKANYTNNCKLQLLQESQPKATNFIGTCTTVALIEQQLHLLQIGGTQYCHLAHQPYPNVKYTCRVLYDVKEDTSLADASAIIEENINLSQIQTHQNIEPFYGMSVSQAVDYYDLGTFDIRDFRFLIRL
ncbi:unnamed protein product [Mytilus coruscus]|uniref:Protein kinase domain-containing protein n=1 Tax=Mytilus coruscus TaxID=42192 RepID=A0A6J8EFK8_MYTCO|nr:unnamed protein product [Mytilus coruscus]